MRVLHGPDVLSGMHPQEQIYLLCIYIYIIFIIVIIIIYNLYICIIPLFQYDQGVTVTISALMPRIGGEHLW